jgi:two-component system, sensor histidine kinase and response regulator
MKRSNLTVKIWRSIGIFIMGSLLTTTLVQVQGRFRERSLLHTSRALFPAAQKAQDADAKFQQGWHTFRVAVLTEDADLLDAGTRLALMSVDHLNAVAAMDGLPQERRRQASSLAGSLGRFTSEVSATYTKPLFEKHDLNVWQPEQMREIARQAAGLQAELTRLKDQCSLDLQANLDSSRKESQRQRDLALIVFAGTLLVSAVMLNFTIRREVVRPLLSANAELQSAKSKAEDASRSKSDFLANMSHEIRTPMNGVLGMTRLVLDSEITHDQRDCLEIAHSSAEALLRIINDILDFSKIEAGRLDMEPVDFDLRQCLAETWGIVALRATERHLEAICEVHPEVPEMVVGDPIRLRQILVNLLGNAVKFTASGEIAISVEVQTREPAKVTLLFAVRDTGIGIPVEKQKLIFEAFSQADASTSRIFGGTGLGLSIASRLVSMMNGRIWVESAPGHGSRFSFTAQLGVSSLHREPAGQLDARALRNVKVLVVDDNATNRRVLEAMLRNWGMLPTCAESADAALSALRCAAAQAPFSLVITDVRMPGADGFDLVARMRAGEPLSRTPVIMLESGGRNEDARRRRQLNVSGHLLKPVRESDLLKTMLAALGAAGRQSSQPEPLEGPVLRPAVQGRLVLVAEDNLVNQRVALRLLERLGHIPTIVASGREAVEAVRNGSFDLVLMDVQMPEMDGFQATAAIREWERSTGGHLPIFALTAHAMKNDEERCLAAGMDGHIPKPIEVNRLRECVEMVPSRRLSPAETALSPT